MKFNPQGHSFWSSPHTQSLKMKVLNIMYHSQIVERHCVYAVLLLSSRDYFHHDTYIWCSMFVIENSSHLQMWLEGQLDLHINNIYILGVGYTVVQTCDLPKHSFLCSTNWATSRSCSVCLTGPLISDSDSKSLQNISNKLRNGQYRVEDMHWTLNLAGHKINQTKSLPFQNLHSGVVSKI